MARLILHVRFFSPSERNRSVKLSNLMNYYGTREGVEKPLPDEWKNLPASENQKEIIQQYRNLLPELSDTHEWEDSIVEFFGQKFHIFGFPKQGIEANIPLRWHKIYKCERYE